MIGPVARFLLHFDIPIWDFPAEQTVSGGNPPGS
jgi:hypothetical protein